MKKLKIVFAGLAVFTAVTTMSFTMTETKTAQANDCWSTIARHQASLPADRNQLLNCPGTLGVCCVKPNGSGGYITYGFAGI